MPAKKKPSKKTKSMSELTSGHEELMKDLEKKHGIQETEEEQEEFTELLRKSVQASKKKSRPSVAKKKA